MTSVENEIVPKLRRAIGDNEIPYSYNDLILTEYIEDAIDKMFIFWAHEYEVDRDNHLIEPTVLKHHQILFAMQAKLDMLERQPNISFKTGSLSVTRKDDAKRRLSEKIDEIINDINTEESMVGFLTEYDDYANRLEEWFYVKTIS